MALNFGIFMTFCSFVRLFVMIIRKLLLGDLVIGWESTICVIIFSGVIQFFYLEIIGKYIVKTYIEIKHRLHYIISETK